MSGHVQSEVTNEHHMSPVKMIVPGGKDVIKTEVKEELELSQCTEEMETHSFTCVERLKCEQSEHKLVIREVVLEDTLDIERQGLIDDKDIKCELLEETIDIEEHELFLKKDGQHEESGGTECLKPEGTVSAKRCKQTQPEIIEDRSPLAPSGQNISKKPRTHKTVKEESSVKTTHMLRSTETTEINSQVNIDGVNDCSNTNIDVDDGSSTYSNMYISNDSDKDKYLKIRHIDHHVIKNKGNRESFQERKLKPSGTGVVNKQTETYKRNLLYECEICRRKFNRAGNLETHLRTHTGERPFECEICKFSFKRKNNLKIHVRIHTGEKPFECEICKFRVNTKCNLKRHLRTHTGERPFECEICKFKFKRSNHLKVHMRTHTGEKPFECEICKFRVSDKCNLKRHLKTHTDEKPFQCDRCDVRFGHKISLINHIRIHTGGKPFECEICNVKFNWEMSLRAHLKVHTDKKPFECDKCKVTFNRKSHLTAHLKLHAGEKLFDEGELCK